jgi:hypothetical protein
VKPSLSRLSLSCTVSPYSPRSKPASRFPNPMYPYSALFLGSFLAQLVVSPQMSFFLLPNPRFHPNLSLILTMVSSQHCFCTLILSFRFLPRLSKHTASIVLCNFALCFFSHLGSLAMRADLLRQREAVWHAFGSFEKN